jgi:hypothetical protein
MIEKHKLHNSEQLHQSNSEADSIPRINLYIFSNTNLLSYMLWDDDLHHASNSCTVSFLNDLSKYVFTLYMV